MLGRAEVVNVLIHEGVREVTAWLIAMNINPQYLEATDEAKLRHDIDNIIWDYMDRSSELESDYAAPV